MLLHKIPLTYSMTKCSTRLLEVSSAAVPHQRAAVPRHLPQQRLIHLHHLFNHLILLQFLKLMMNMMKIKKKMQKALITHDYDKQFNGITPLITSLGVFERELLLDLI